MVVGVLGSKLGEWLPGTTSKASVQKRGVLGKAKILRRTLKPRPLVEDPSLRTYHPKWGCEGDFIQRKREIRVQDKINFSPCKC